MKYIIQFRKYKIIAFLICGIIIGSCSRKQTKLVTSGDIKIKSKWVKEHFLSYNPQLPFSFLYDGKASDELLKTWQKKTENK